MMEFSQIQELLKLVNELNIAEVKLKNGDFSLSIRSKAYMEAKQQQAGNQYLTPPPFPMSYMSPAAMVVPPPNIATADNIAVQKPATQETHLKADAPTAADANLITIKSPMIGTLYRSPGPDKAPFVKVGDTINKGSKLCIIEAMKLFNEIEAEVSGTIVRVLAEDNSPVEYDQPLFLVQP